MLCVTDFGAASGAANVSSAFQSAVNAAAQAGGGIVHVPPGVWNLTTTITISASNIRIIGAGRATNIVGQGGSDIFQFTGNAEGCGLERFRFTGTAMTGGGFVRTSNSHRMLFQELELLIPRNAFTIGAANVCSLKEIWCYGAAGAYFLRWAGDDASRSDVLNIENVTASGAAVSPPDGIVWDGNCHSMRIHACGLVGFRKGLHVLRTAGATSPAFLRAHALEVDFPTQEAALLAAGTEFTFTGCYLHGSKAEHGLKVGSGVDRVRYLGGNITGHAKAGVNNAGTNVDMIGVQIQDNSQAGAGTHSGVENESGGEINVIGGSIEGGNQQYGINNKSGAARSAVEGANLRNNQLGPCVDGSAAQTLAIGKTDTDLPLAVRPYFTSPAAYLTAPIINLANAAITANRLYMLPFWVTERRAFTALVIANVNVSAAGSARAGLYRANPRTGKPTTLVADAGAVAVNAVGTKTFAIAQTLDPGMYFFALVSDANPTLLSNETPGALGVNIGGGLALINGLFRAFAYAALPPDESSSIFTLGIGPMPTMGIR